MYISETVQYGTNVFRIFNKKIKDSLTTFLYIRFEAIL